MKLFNIKIILLFLLVLGFSLPENTLSAQQYTKIRGKIIDAKTKEALPFVNIVIVGKSIGTMTDDKGEYEIATQWASNKIQASFLGYKAKTKKVLIGKRQTINFKLDPENLQLEEVEVVTKRKRYRNKNNPAVELIRKVIHNKKANRLEAHDYYEYDKYEKVEFDLNNITKKFQNKKAFKKFQFVFNYVDTSKVNGKPYLPVFLKETVSEVYFRKNPNSKKEFITGNKMIGFHDYIDNDGVSYILDHIYQDINIYDNNITLLTNQFVSPISPLSPNIYRFHIIDTTMVGDDECIKLAFHPRNKADFAFKGHMLITNDGVFSVKRVHMKVTEDINLNFVNDLQIDQEFKKLNDGSWIITKNELTVDFNITKKGLGMFGKRTVHTDNYVFNKKREEEKYDGVVSKIMAVDRNEKDSTFWKEKRLVKLGEKEEGIYTMVDSIKHVPAFKTAMDIVMLLVAGYWNFDKFDVGPVNSFYSWNDVEGLRLRVGGRTSDKFSKTFRIDGFGAYGFKDEKFKYSINLTQSLNKRSLKERPHHEISLMYQKETNFPGMEMMFINEDNVLLSIKRGVADKILYYDILRLRYEKEWKYGLTTTLILKKLDQQAGGTLVFQYPDHQVNNIASSEITGIIRFAPNETYYQGLDYKVPILSKYPVFQLSYTHGFEGVFHGDFNYDKLKLAFFKRVYMSPIGYANVELEGGKIFGKVPYPLLYIPRANQTYSYQLRSYNLMNFLEFVSDQYVSLFVEHNFNGFIFNKIPLVKHLKLRSIISFKGIYGNVTDANNPDKTAGLMLFPTTDGKTSTYTLEQDPYIEISAGIGNIFKIFRVDVVKRLTYLDNPNVAGIGIRVRFKIEF